MSRKRAAGPLDYEEEEGAPPLKVQRSQTSSEDVLTFSPAALTAIQRSLNATSFAEIPTTLSMSLMQRFMADTPSLHMGVFMYMNATLPAFPLWMRTPLVYMQIHLIRRFVATYLVGMIDATVSQSVNQYVAFVALLQLLAPDSPVVIFSALADSKWALRDGQLIGTALAYMGLVSNILETLDAVTVSVQERGLQPTPTALHEACDILRRDQTHNSFSALSIPLCFLSIIGVDGIRAICFIESTRATGGLDKAQANYDAAEKVWTNGLSITNLMHNLAQLQAMSAFYKYVVAPLFAADLYPVVRIIRRMIVVQLARSKVDEARTKVLEYKRPLPMLNLTGSCFANSVLQCLKATPLFCVRLANSAALGSTTASALCDVYISNSFASLRAMLQEFDLRCYIGFDPLTFYRNVLQKLPAPLSNMFVVQCTDLSILDLIHVAPMLEYGLRFMSAVDWASLGYFCAGQQFTVALPLHYAQELPARVTLCENTCYELYGVVCSTGGHAYTYVEEEDGAKQWYRCSDEKITPTSQHEALNPHLAAGYSRLLFFHRVNG